MKKVQAAALTPEWPHKFETSILGSKPLQVKLETTVQQRKDLARRAGVVSVEALEAQMTLARTPGNGLIHVTGTLEGAVIQTCAVTMDKIQTRITDEFDAWYTDHAQVVSLAGVRREKEGLQAGAELAVTEEKDDPEPAVDGFIDLGELAAQYFCLAIDPYVHAENINYENSVETGMSEVPSSRPNPFAALKNWRAGRNGGKL
ncbi:MAG TPA: DUF177 domain-containing protein, partial [Alphaproteobacteria bacterium]